MALISNIVKKDVVREVQKEALDEIMSALLPSFGPMGSTTTIDVENKLTQYSKDGHTILKHLSFKDPIECRVRDDLEELTTYVVRTVGDGTTSCAILSKYIFDQFMQLETDMTPFEIIQKFKECVGEIKEVIESRAMETTPEIMYKIAYISTNGNKEVAENIKYIYENFGNEVFIDVGYSNTTENLLKSYDGMTIQSGYSDTAYINDTDKAVCSIRNPKIYAFKDPVDTREMVTFLDIIIKKNIYDPMQNREELIPTVILCPKLSRDLSAYMDNIITLMNQFEQANQANHKPPFLLVTNIYNEDIYYDVARMCGCKEIKKYIDPTLQEKDIEAGLAPTPETILDFAGTADLVEADLVKTKFVNPKLMHDENGELSSYFKQLVEFLEAELQKAYQENQDNNVTGQLKRRIHSLKANMVDYLVGGITAADRDELKDFVEDAVLNCRSAAEHGYGFGANFEGLRASYELLDSSDPVKNNIFRIIHEAYRNLTYLLYETRFGSTGDDEQSVKILELIDSSLKNNCPWNIKTLEKGEDVLSSIKSDVVILEVISKIISLMITTNQFLCKNFAMNVYLTRGIKTKEAPVKVTFDTEEGEYTLMKE